MTEEYLEQAGPKVGKLKNVYQNALMKMSEETLRYSGMAARVWHSLSIDHQDELVSLVKHGPLWDGSTSENEAREDLVSIGLAVKVVHNEQTGYTAATPRGLLVYNDRPKDESEILAKAARTIGLFDSGQVRD